MMNQMTSQPRLLDTRLLLEKTGLYSVSNATSDASFSSRLGTSFQALCKSLNSSVCRKPPSLEMDSADGAKKSSSSGGGKPDSRNEKSSSAKYAYSRSNVSQNGREEITAERKFHNFVFVGGVAVLFMSVVGALNFKAGN